MKDWNKVFTASEQARLGRRLVAKQRNAESRGIICTLTMEDMFMLGAKLLGHGCCDYTNLAFSVSLASDSIENASSNPRYPTLERIDDKKGYERGNMCVVMLRANQLKDKLVDKMSSLSLVDQLDREIVQAMILNMSKEHLEQLKTKYIPQQENEMSVEQAMAVNEEHGSDIIAMNTVIYKGEKGEKGPVESGDWNSTDHGVTEQKEPVKLPEDVAVALAYANYCKTFSDVGMKVSVTYAQFKAKYTRNTCAMTGEKLKGEPKSILIMDLDIGFARDNFVIVSKKMETAMTQLMIQTGLSLPAISAMLKKVV